MQHDDSVTGGTRVTDGRGNPKTAAAHRLARWAARRREANQGRLIFADESSNRLDENLAERKYRPGQQHKNPYDSHVALPGRFLVLPQRWRANNRPGRRRFARVNLVHS